MRDATPAADEMDGANGAMLVIISGPSGVGKDTIIDALRRRHHDPEYHYVVTCTTRAKRPGEVDGIDYHFLDRATFAARRRAGEFLEANDVHGNWYGTPRSQVREKLAEGRDVQREVPPGPFEACLPGIHDLRVELEVGRVEAGAPAADRWPMAW